MTGQWVGAIGEPSAEQLPGSRLFPGGYSGHSAGFNRSNGDLRRAQGWARDLPAGGPLLADDVLSVFDVVAAAGDAVDLDGIVAATGLAAETVHRALEGMRRHGLLDRTKNGSEWEVGLRTLELAQAYRRRSAIVAASSSVLRQIRDITNETVVLLVRRGVRCACIDQEAPEGPGQVDIQEGVLSPLHASAGGMALLAVMPDEHIEGYIASVQDLQPGHHPELDVAAVKQSVAEIRRSGTAKFFRERSGSVGIAVAIPDAFDRSGSALGVLLPRGRFVHETGVRIEQLLLSGAEEIADRLERILPRGTSEEVA